MTHSPGQSACSLTLSILQFYAKNQDGCFLPASLLPRLGYLRFFLIVEIESSDTIDDKNIFKNKILQNFFVKWKHPWENCVNRGEYFEDDKDRKILKIKLVYNALSYIWYLLYL